MTTWWVGPDDLNTEQQDVIDLDQYEDHVILGPPGSGKTNLLLLRANYLYLGEQKNIEVIVYTRALHRFLKFGGANYDFPDSKIRTLKAWQRGLLRSYNEEIPKDEDFSEERRLLSDAIEELIRKRKLSGIVECFLLDEAHDYTPQEIRIFRKLGKRIFAVADTRQKIYSTPDCIEALKDGVKSIHTLKFHYRVGKNICVVADQIGKDSADYVPMLPTCNYDEVKIPSSVERIPCSTLDQQVERAVSTLEVQIKAYPNEMIGVLCPTNDAVQAVWERIQKSSIADVSMLQAGDEHPNFTDDVRVFVSTVHSAKGLEFRAVHFLAADQLTKLATNNRNVAFTAVTRAKTSLAVYHTGQLAGFVEQALAAVEPTKNVPSVGDAFGPRRSRKT